MVTNLKKLKAEFYCHFPDCVYNGPKKYFSAKKFLNQHVAKVHAEKKYLCEKCGRGFGMDWWRKHHEKTCGYTWLCDCGSKFSSREAILTHARRTGHDLPKDVVVGQIKRKPTKVEDKPIILLIQPVIQNVDNIPNLYRNSSLSPISILPNHSPFSIAVQTDTKSTQANISPTIKISNQSSIGYNYHQNAVVPQLFNSNCSTITPISKTVATQTLKNNSSLDNSVKEFDGAKYPLISTATQTITDHQTPHKIRESRASQCSRRKSKSSVTVGNESTHTQTAESAVTRIKRKRSRRKSVAITTEQNMLTYQNEKLDDSVWSNFKDLILRSPDYNASQSFTNTMSTQTNHPHSKILCDSQTITDEELLKFDWAYKVSKDYDCNISKAFTVPIGIPPINSLAAMPNNIVCNNLPEFNLFSTGSNLAENKHSQNNFHAAASSSESCQIFDMFDDCQKSDAVHEISHPVLSDIHTQTMANSELDFNLLANMETQTTDDFALYDLLELSDTETQTPWDDFLDIDESPLQPDQFSIEIQTDFSAFNTGLNPDPYSFFSGSYVQNMIDVCSDKEKMSVNIETQTHDGFNFPQLTNSESQTSSLGYS